MKVTSLLALLCLLTISASAQEDTSRWSLEILGGPSFSTFYSSEAPVKIFEVSMGPYYKTVPYGYRPEDDRSYYPYSSSLLSMKRTGITFQLLAARRISKHYTLVTGLGWEQKGVSHSEQLTQWDGLSFRSDTFSFSNQELLSKVQNNYITMPLLVRRVFASGITLDAGGYVGYLLTSHLRQTIKKENFEQRGQGFSQWGSTVNFGPDVNTARIDAGLVLAAGYKRALFEKTSFLARAAGSVGLLKVDGKYDNDYSQDFFFNGYILRQGNYHGYSSSAKNLQLQVTVGVSRSL
jgi:hypothetical protein